MLPDRGFFAGLYCLLRLDRLEQKAKLYYGKTIAAKWILI